jgi:hypothetical protein
MIPATHAGFCPKYWRQMLSIQAIHQFRWIVFCGSFFTPSRIGDLITIELYLFPVACVFALFTSSCSNRLATHQQITLGTPADLDYSPRGKEASVTYPSGNGYLIRSEDTAIVVAPYFSRLPTWGILFRKPFSLYSASLSLGVRWHPEISTNRP